MSISDIVKFWCVLQMMPLLFIIVFIVGAFIGIVLWATVITIKRKLHNYRKGKGV